MQNGEYIVDRWMVHIVREICRRRGIAVASFSDDWLLELTKDSRVARILGYKFSLNDLVAGNIAQDKVAAYQLLRFHNVPAVPHFLIRTKASESDWKTWRWQDGMVVKPLTGTSGHAIGRFDSALAAETWMSERGIEAWAASQYVDIQREIRITLLDDEVLLAYEKLPVIIGNLKMFNLGKGATPREYSPTKAQIRLAKQAQKVLGLRLSAVDIVELPGGEHMVLEVNDGIMMENYARYSDVGKENATAVYGAILGALFDEKGV